VAASKVKCVRRGVKEVVKAVRKGEKGVCIIAGNISPIDVISHLPVLCEDNDVPYVFVPSKEALGTAGQTKRPTSCVLIKKGGDGDLKEKYQECFDKVKKMQEN
jgi:H/ACA ribonucleoprotein complex subunit 2